MQCELADADVYGTLFSSLAVHACWKYAGDRTLTVHIKEFYLSSRRCRRRTACSLLLDGWAK